MRSATSWLLAIAPLCASTALAQTQIKPRVILMVDTSGSMTERIDSATDTGGDGRQGGYTDASGFVRSVAATPGYAYGEGFSLSASCNPPNPNDYQGIFSRMFAAKAAVTNVVNASGDIDWGLMRYAGTYCPVLATATGGFACTANNQCTTNNCTVAPNRRCTCATDDDCRNDEFCIAGKCNKPDSLCNNNVYAMADRRNTTACRNHYAIPATYTGTTCPAASRVAAGDVACLTQEACFGLATDCNGSAARCQNKPGTTSVKSCTCATSADCDTNYICGTGANAGRCVYNLGCLAGALGGVLEVDPAAGTSLNVLPWVNGSENYTASAGPFFVSDPELAPDGNTPLAAAARAAATWYATTSAADTKAACRPYVLVQITDGIDTCDGNADFGPPAGARMFVNATVPNAKTPNKVYVIGLSIASATDQTRLNNTAAAGGTGAARFATSQADIEAALADIVASSVLVEKCNNADDDCNGVCDEPFPDVALTAANGCAPRAAKTCNNNATAGTKCFATGAFVCAASQLAEECNAPNCTVGSPFFDAAHCPTAETCNGQDDDCNGVIDDCTPFVPGSCCVGMCPACNPTGVPQPETCNGCDDDCDGVADNHLTDSGIACGSSVGICVQGTTACCQQVNPTVGSCSTDPVTQSAVHNNPDKLACLGGFGPGVAACNGLDNDCDGVKDPAARSCYPFASGTPGQGSCVAGTQSCTTLPLPAGNPGCPVGWPAGKPCPNPVASYGACVGANGPGVETCNNFDDDCDGTRDDSVTDPWVGQPCCPTGNLADCANSGGSTTCGLGAYACVGGSKTCVGGRAKTTEICDGADNDCNGVVDDVLGKNAPCSGPGIVTGGECTARYQCTGSPGPGPNGLTCVQVIGPQPETCNLMDDDCNGTIDDNLADPRVGVSGGSPCPALTPLPGTSFPVSGPAPPCNPGVTACVNGNVVCNGFQGPEPNQCDGISRDCTGMANSNGNCPTGFMCYQGNCVSQCAGGEFPCPGGFVCVMGLCIPDACNKAMCAADQICRVDVNGNAVCEDPCKNVNCPTGYRCKQGVCVDDTCRTFGCPTGQICTGSPPTCVDDPCFNVMCPAGQYCSGGSCVMPCTGMCPPGEECVGGQCVMDPCANLRCPSGQVCAVSGGVGMCVDDLCAATGCGSGSACCGGQCIVDPCASQSCPSGTVCELTSACGTRCAEPPPGDKVQIVPAGGGGISCTAVPGAPAPGASASFVLLLLGVLGLHLRRFARKGAR